MTQIWDATNPGSMRFRSGQTIPQSGLYRVVHAEHRLAHEVTLLENAVFPACSQCQNSVHFELLRSAPQITHDRDFRIRLYSLPVIEPDEDEAQSDSAKAS